MHVSLTSSEPPGYLLLTPYRLSVYHSVSLNGSMKATRHVRCVVTGLVDRDVTDSRPISVSDGFSMDILYLSIFAIQRPVLNALLIIFT